MTSRSSGHKESGVIGTGEVGLRLSIAMANAGYDVIGVDAQEERVNKLNRGESYIEDFSDRDIARLLDRGFRATTDYSELTDVDYVSVCVPTPLRKSGTPDISYVVDAIERLADVVAPGTTIIIESTVYPGATENIFTQILKAAGFSVGDEIYLAFSPERVDPGNEEYTLTEIPKVVGGVTLSSTRRAVDAYEVVFDELVPVESATEAEMAKVLENTFRNVNIALVNELVKVAESFGVNFWNVIEAADTKPYGFMSFYPGPGLGGHCIPVDPVYLSWKSKQEGRDTPLVDLADRTNRRMSEYIVQRLTQQLNESGVPVPDTDILLLGAAYKPDVSDVRNAPAKDLFTLLEQRNANVSYHDPHVDRLEVQDETYSSREFSPDLLERQDCVVVVTDHSRFDWQQVVDHSPLVFDTRNALSEYGASHIEVL